MKAAKGLRANCSGQLLIVAALAIAILIASTSIYVYELTTESQNMESGSGVELALAMKTGLRNAVISALANITNGGQKTVLTENLDTLAKVYMQLYPQKPCQIRYTLLNSSGYKDGVKLLWSEGFGVSSVYIPYTLKILGPASNITINDTINVTTALLIDGHHITGENETVKTVNLICKIFNEEKPAQAKNITIYWWENYELQSVENLLVTDLGNGMYAVSFTVATISNTVYTSINMVDTRNISVKASISVKFES